ncbi:MAG: CPBP family intramembrane metalloprotease [Lachnospiraceae bacterium]|nr:CPBP family intramembrane metalloprotease [Lachnospiraceae bacterium]
MHSRGRTAGIVLGTFACYILGFLLLRRYFYPVLRRICGFLHITYIGGYFAAALFELALLLFVLLMMTCTGQLRVLRAPRGTFFRGLFTGGFMIVMGLYAIVSAVISRMGSIAFQGKGTILFSTVLFIFTGMAEEFMFRGITADVLLRGGSGAAITFGHVWMSVFISGLLFGLMHALNFLSARPEGVIVQMISAALIGMLIAAIYCRSGNIWVVAAIHAFNDIAAGFPTLVLRGDSGISGIIGSYGFMHLLTLLPYGIALLFLLRRSKMKEIAEKFAP